jgi:hypothetical protein
MSDTALAETRRANIEQVRSGLRSAYATWLGHLDQYLVGVQRYAVEKQKKSGRYVTRNFSLLDDLTKSAEDAELSSFFLVRLVDVDKFGTEKAEALRVFDASPIDESQVLLDRTRARRIELVEFADWLSTTIQD